MRVQLVGFWTILDKEVTRIFRIWPQTLLPSVITMTLYFLIFGSFIGSRLGKVAGVSYIEFIVPGLIMMSVITNSYANVSSSVFGAKFQKNIEEMLVSPMSYTTILAGYVSGGVLRGVLVGILVSGVSLFFTDIHLTHVVACLGVIFLTALAFSLAGFLNAVFARKFDDISIVPTFVLTPLTYLGGIFYSIHHLPAFWQTVSLINPVLYIVNLFRHVYLGVSDISPMPAFFALLVFTGVLWGACWWLLKSGMGLRQ